jgi:hypothetical protein
MTTALPARLTSSRLSALALATLGIYAVELAVARVVPPSLPVRAAMAFDLVIVVPAVWWFLGLRRIEGGARRLVTVALASVTGATLVVPQIGLLLRALAAPLELALLAAAALAVRRALRASPTTDVAEAWERALVSTVGDNALARIVAAEASAVYHATVGFRRVAVAVPGRVFTLAASRSPAFTYGLAFVTVVESIGLHAWLGAAHPLIAWMLTALGAYAILWLVGQDRAIVARAVEIDSDTLVLRAGLRLTARVRFAAVAAVEVVSWTSAPEPRPGYLDVARPVEPSLVITFREPVEVTGMLGLRRSVTAIGLGVDDPTGLRDAIVSRCPPAV